MTGDDTGWNLPEFASNSHAPALDEKVLVSLTISTLIPHYVISPLSNMTTKIHSGKTEKRQVQSH